MESLEVNQILLDGIPGQAGLPDGVTWGQLAGAGCLAGIGFTMSLFISDLAFPGDQLVDEAKMGILAASLIAVAAGYAVLRFSFRHR